MVVAGISEIKKLVEKFDSNKHIHSSYNEENTKIEFINPFFEALGWDLGNKHDKAPQYKDVVFEDSVKVGNKIRAPDYCFRYGGNRKFFVEAKKPSEKIDTNKSHAFQIRRYGWSAKLSLCILTNFEELAIYETTTRPNKNQNASIGRIKYYKYTDYVEKWDEIWNIFSYESIEKGRFDNFVDGHEGIKKGTSEVDNEFLDEIENWRLILAKNIALRNKELTIEQLNHAVQLTIDRIIFLRIAEDRGIEKYGQLQRISELANNDKDDYPVYREFIKLCKKADAKYNSGLFHFKEEKGIKTCADELTPNLKIDDGKFKQIFKNLYYPNCPYEFSVISTEILGNIYERFLGKRIRLTESHQAKVEEKPEVKKAGGVFYTPKYIVDYIVENTMGVLLEGKTPNQVSKMRFVDPACGSGSFLLGAFQYLIDWHIWYYSKLKKPPKDVIYTGKDGITRLTVREKKRIVLNNIYGVDIDPQAVEVSMLSLLLKVLEDSNKDELEAQQKLFQERALPYLGDNIKCGNTLIGTDILEQDLEMDEIAKINPFDWEEEFKKVFENGVFDAVIGNPPYVSWSEMLNRTPFENGKYLDLEYSCRPNHKDAQPNLYMFFLIKTLNLINNGFVGYILPQEWLFQVQDFRDYLLSNTGEIKIFKFDSEFRVFKNKNCVVGTNSLILFLENNNKNKLSIYETSELDENEVQKLLKDYPEVRSDKLSFNTSTKDRFINNRWEFFNDFIESILSKSSDFVDFKNKDYFKVIGGFQPNIDLSKKYILSTDEGLNQLEKSFIFPCIYEARSFKRYYLNDENQYWVVLNKCFDKEIDFKNKCPNLFKILSSRLKTNKNKWWSFLMLGIWT